MNHDVLHYIFHIKFPILDALLTHAGNLFFYICADFPEAFG